MGTTRETARRVGALLGALWALGLGGDRPARAAGPATAAVRQWSEAPSENESALRARLAARWNLGGDAWVEVRRTRARDGREHVAWQQTHAGLPVEGAELFLTLEGGRVRAVRGRVAQGLPALHARRAREAGEVLALDPDGAWKRVVRRGATTPPRAPRPAPEAPLSNVSTVGLSLYDGSVVFTAQQDAALPPPSDLTLAMAGAPFTLQTLDDFNLGQAGGGAPMASPFGAGRTQAGVSAHWAAEQALLYFQNVLGRSGIDDVPGAPLPLEVEVHYCSAPCSFDPGGHLRARWLPGLAGLGLILAGDGDGVGTLPQVGVDTLARELVKGVQEYAVGNVQVGRGFAWSGQAGAIAEGLADVFGQRVKAQVKPATWITGEDDTLSPALRRNLADPLASGHPDAPGGTHWVADPDAPGQGLKNSTVVSHWFHLAAAGGSGTNSLGQPYALVGVGFEELEQIAYDALVSGLPRTATFADLRDAAILSARGLYGSDAQEEITVTDAWAAVGVGGAYVDPLPYSPANGATGVPIDVELSFAPRPNETQWTLEIDVSASLSSPALQTFTLAAPHTGVPGLALSQKYYWRVTGWDGQRWGTPRPVRSFTTGNALPGQLAPASTGVVLSSFHPWALDFTWSAVGGATSYDVQVATDSAFAVVVRSASVPAGPAPQATFDLRVLTTYYWRVRAVLPNATGPWAWAAFKTTKPKPQLVPLGGAGVNAWWARVSWQPVKGAVRYLVERNQSALSLSQGVGSDAGLVDSPSLAAVRQYAQVNANQVWYWRVTPLGPAGAGSEWGQPSATDSYKVDFGQTAAAWSVDTGPGPQSSNPWPGFFPLLASRGILTTVRRVDGATSYTVSVSNLKWVSQPPTGYFTNADEPVVATFTLRQPLEGDPGPVFVEWPMPLPLQRYGVQLSVRAKGPGGEAGAVSSNQPRLAFRPAYDLVSNEILPCGGRHMKFVSTFMPLGTAAVFFRENDTTTGVEVRSAGPAEWSGEFLTMAHTLTLNHASGCAPLPWITTAFAPSTPSGWLDLMRSALQDPAYSPWTVMFPTNFMP